MTTANRRLTEVSNRAPTLLLATCLLALPRVATAAEIRVGAGGAVGNCDAASVQEAVDLAEALGGEHEIRLSNDSFYIEDVFISNDVSNAKLTISGGWDTCEDTTPNDRTFFSGARDALTGGPLTITSNKAEGQKHIVLRDLILQGAAIGEPYQEIGVEIAGAYVQFENVHITQSATGLLVHSGALVEVDEDSAILGNEGDDSSFGGGVTCGYPPAFSGAGTEIRMAGHIALNRATRGAGILAQSGCTIVLQPGAVITANFASASGGGIYLTSGASLFANGSATQLVVVSRNTAVTGGGIYAVGSGTDAFLSNLFIVENYASGSGGGIGVGGSAFVRFNRSNSTPCPGAANCAVLSENEVNNASGGSAAFVESGGRLELQQVTIERGLSAGAGPVLRAQGTASTIHAEGISMWRNRAISLFSATDEAIIVAAFVSAADNTWLVDSNGNPILRSRIASASGDATIDLHASIFQDTSGSTGPNVTGRCLLMDDGSGIVAGNSLIGPDPEFVDPQNGDLHLQATSPAIDFCDGGYFPNDLDIDLEPRFYDLPGNINGIGTLDLGFDEYYGPPPGTQDAIFFDGFETGSTSRWSSGP